MSLRSYKFETGRSLQVCYAAISAGGETRYTSKVFTRTPESSMFAALMWQSAARSPSRNLFSFCSLLARIGVRIEQKRTGLISRIPGEVRLSACRLSADAALRFGKHCHPYSIQR